MTEDEFPTFENILRNQLQSEKDRKQKIQSIRKEMGLDVEEKKSVVPILKKSFTPKTKVQKTNKSKARMKVRKTPVRKLKSDRKGIARRRKAVLGLAKLFKPSSPIPKKKKTKLSPQQKARLRALQQMRGSNISKKQMQLEYEMLRKKQILENTLRNQQQSNSFKRLRDSLIAIQNKAKSDNNRKMRQIRESRALMQMSNLMKAHENLNKIQLDFTKLPEGDKSILNADNIFKENPENNILRKRGISILNTKEAGNNLQF